MLLSNLLTRIRAYVRYWWSVRELSQLSDRQLRDLGISRGNLHAVARHAAGL